MSVSAEELLTTPMTQKEWTGIIQRCLRYLCSCDPAESSNLFKSERQPLPKNFAPGPSQFCYAFKGTFLPSGNQDGKVWKPSQGAKPTGNGLMKRYFYNKESNVKIKRQVIWLTEDDSWCFLDYRCNFKGKIKIKDMHLPEHFDFVQLITLADQHAMALPATVVTKGVKLEPVAQLKFKMEADLSSYLQNTTVDPQQSAAPFTTPFSMESAFYLDTTARCNVPTLTSQDPLESYGFAQSPLLELPEFCTDNFTSPLDTTTFPNELEYLEPNLTDFIGNSLTSDASSSTTDYSYTQPTSPPFSSYLQQSNEEPELYPLTKRAKVAPSTPAIAEPLPPARSNFLLSGFDYLLSHLLSYDQVVDFLAQQIIVNRRFFKRANVDTSAVLAFVKQDTVFSVDLREFPGNIINSFFNRLVQVVFPFTYVSPPPLYCMVCGKSGGEHDEHTHTRFYSSLDHNLLTILQCKAKSLYELIRGVIMYILRSPPQSRQSFQAFIMENLHCPYCAAVHGQHSAEHHRKWTNFWQAIYGTQPPQPSMEPTPSLDTDTYIRKAFDYIINNSCNIPSFIYNLSNFRSLVDCLVTIWSTIRLL